jgi:galactose oxidase
MIRTIGRAFASGFVSCVCVAGAAAQTEVRIPQTIDRLITNLVIPANSAAHIEGLWTPLQSWRLNPIHMVVLPDGRVATFGSALDTPGTSFGVKFDIWNPRRGFVPGAHRILANADDVDSFCAASTLLKTGELWTSGGRQETLDYLPNDRAVILNPSRNSVGPVIGMAYRRYYATLTTLADGGHLLSGGSVGSSTTYSYENPGAFAAGWPSVPEVYRHGTGWSTLSGVFIDKNTPPDTDGDYRDDAFGPGDNHWWYPRQWVAPDGKVFGFSTRQIWYLDPDAGGGVGSITLDPRPLHASEVGPGKPNVGASSTAVMYGIGRILQVGGNGRLEGQVGHDNFASSETAKILDINSGMATFVDADPLPPILGVARGRQWANATVLPNGRVLLTGGTAVGNSEADAVKHAAIWNPEAPPGQNPQQQWTYGAAASEFRGYHSSAVLLPNGTVLTGGGGAVQDHPGQLNVEVYYPPYLFQQSGSTSVLAPRPRVQSMNALKFNHETGVVRARVNSDSPIVKAALIGLGSTTHSFDMGQRLYPIAPPALTVSGSDISFVAPHRNYTPPGYYLLFVTNANGVPSPGVIIAIGANVAPPPRDPAPTDYDGDGISDPAFFRPSNGYFSWRRSSDGAQPSYSVAATDDIPLVGDYDGDGITDPAFFRPSNGYFSWRRSSDGTQPSYSVATAGDIPLVGDYDGDGISDPAFFRPSNGYFSWRRSSDGTQPSYSVAAADDIPLVGDYDGDGITDPAFFRPSNGYFSWRRSSDGTQPSYSVAAAGDIPLVGDYDGDGITDPAFFRPSNGYFSWRRSSDGAQPSYSVAAAGDIPLGTSPTP